MPSIRPATIQDLPGAYRVGLLTGDAGRDASALFRNPELLGHVYVGPYIVGEPDLALVVVDEDGVAGYLLGAADTRAFEAWTEAEWWPPLRERYPRRGDGSPEAELIDRLHAPPSAPDAVVGAFPAHLHLDLLERVRGRGYGRMLMEWLMARLRDGGTAGVHLDVAGENENAISFYRHMGFEIVEPHPTWFRMGARLL
jgi:ribosomal protein S18 acetylase RimI-like enzyme